MKLEIKYTEIATMKCYFPISLCSDVYVKAELCCSAV